MPTNLGYKAREKERKRERRQQASGAQREKGRQRSRARDKERRGDFFVEQHENFVAAVRNASGHQSNAR